MPIDPLQEIISRSGADPAARLAARVAELERRLDGMRNGPLMTGPRVAFPLAGTWVAVNPGVQPVTYRKDALGVVWLTGLVTIAAGVAAGTVLIGNLPPGYRPKDPESQSHGALVYLGAGGYQQCQVIVDGTTATAGNISIHTFGGIPAGGWLSLQDLCFLAEA